MTAAATLSVASEQFEQVCGEWSDLLARTAVPTPFVTPAFQRVWLDHFQGGRQVELLTVRDGERLIGIAPMLRSDGEAEFVGHYSICDYMDAVVLPGLENAFFGAILAELSAMGVRRIDLRGLRASSASAGAVIDAGGHEGYAATREEEALSPAVQLPGTWEEYLGALSKKDRHELRRKLRRLIDGGGGVDLQVVTEPAEAGERLETLFHLMRVSSHHKEEFLDRPRMQEFFRDVVAAMAAEGMLRFYFLTFDGQPVASVLNFDLGGQLYMYNSGYDPQYSHLAVGLMSKALLVKDAIENGRTCVDFLRGDESYKYDLGGKDQQVYRVVLTR